MHTATLPQKNLAPKHASTCSGPFLVKTDKEKRANGTEPCQRIEDALRMVQDPFGVKSWLLTVVNVYECKYSNVPHLWRSDHLPEERHAPRSGSVRSGWVGFSDPPER